MESRGLVESQVVKLVLEWCLITLHLVNAINIVDVIIGNSPAELIGKF